MNPQSAEAHLGLGVVAFSEGNCALAQSEYAEAEQLNPQLAGLHARQGACLMRRKHYGGAIAAFRKEIEVSGDDEASERSLAEAYTGEGHDGGSRCREATGGKAEGKGRSGVSCDCE